LGFGFGFFSGFRELSNTASFLDFLHPAPLPLQVCQRRLVSCPVGGILLTHCSCRVLGFFLKSIFLQDLNQVSQNRHMQKLCCCEDLMSELSNVASSSFKRICIWESQWKRKGECVFPLVQSKFLREFTKSYSFTAPTEITAVVSNLRTLV